MYEETITIRNPFEPDKEPTIMTIRYTAEDIRKCLKHAQPNTTKEKLEWNDGFDDRISGIF